MGEAGDTALRDELLRLESALARRDPAGLPDGHDGPDALLALIPDDFFEHGASGHTWSAADVRETLATEPPRAVEIEDFAITPLADDVVLATYRARDPRLTLRASIWVRREGGWVMRFHQGTLVDS